MVAIAVIEYSQPRTRDFTWYATNDVEQFVEKARLAGRDQKFIDVLYEFDDALSSVKTLIAREPSFRWASFFPGDKSYVVTFWENIQAYNDFETRLRSDSRFSEFTNLRQIITDDLGIVVTYHQIVESEIPTNAIPSMSVDQLKSLIGSE